MLQISIWSATVLELFELYSLLLLFSLAFSTLLVPVGKESTHKGVNWCSKYVTQVQQRPESPTVTLTWHACKCKVHKLHQRYILLRGLCTSYLHACQVTVTLSNSGLCCCACATYFKYQLTPLCVDSAQGLWASFCFRFFPVGEVQRGPELTNGLSHKSNTPCAPQIDADPSACLWPYLPEWAALTLLVILRYLYNTTEH